MRYVWRMENTTHLGGAHAAVSPVTERPAPLRRYSTQPASEKAAVLADWLEESKARELTVLDVSGKNPCMDVLIVATATSVRHARSLADGLLDQCKQRNFEYLRMEGYQAGQWILVDLNDIVAHIFQAETRDMYRLESLWPDALRLRGSAAARALPENEGSGADSDEDSGD